MPKTLEDLCPGFVLEKHGSGRCCCGLHWVGEMPAHDERGTLLQLDRLLKNQMAADAADERRAETKREFATMGTPHPFVGRIVRGGGDR